MLATNEIMRRKQTENNVRTITTGHAEADMLGQVYCGYLKRKTENMLRGHIEHTRRLENIQLMSCISEVYSERP